jgi:hypothetical protein
MSLAVLNSAPSPVPPEIEFLLKSIQPSSPHLYQFALDGAGMGSVILNVAEIDVTVIATLTRP